MTGERNREEEQEARETKAMRRDAHFMVTFYKTLWDEVDSQFLGLEKEEKLHIFERILMSSSSSSSSENCGDANGQSRRESAEQEREKGGYASGFHIEELLGMDSSTEAANQPTPRDD